MSDDQLSVKVTPGLIEYTDGSGTAQKFYFQCNPTALTRSRSISITETPAADQAAGTADQRAQAGRKLSFTVSRWKFESLELWFDASMPHYTDPNNVSDTGNLAAVEQGIAHLQAMVEPGPVPSENDSVTGYPPTPPPPKITLHVGGRSWSAYVTSVSIHEQQFTPDLRPRQVKATLSLEIPPTNAQLAQNKTGGQR